MSVSRKVVLANYHLFLRALEARLQRPIRPEGGDLDACVEECRRLRAVHARLDGRPGCADRGVGAGLDEAVVLGELAQKVEQYRDVPWNCSKFEGRLVDAYATLAYVDGPGGLELSA